MASFKHVVSPWTIRHVHHHRPASRCLAALWIFLPRTTDPGRGASTLRIGRDPIDHLLRDGHRRLQRLADVVGGGLSRQHISLKTAVGRGHRADRSELVDRRQLAIGRIGGRGGGRGGGSQGRQIRLELGGECRITGVLLQANRVEIDLGGEALECPEQRRLIAGERRPSGLLVGGQRIERGADRLRRVEVLQVGRKRGFSGRRGFLADIDGGQGGLRCRLQAGQVAMEGERNGPTSFPHFTRRSNRLAAFHRQFSVRSANQGHTKCGPGVAITHCLAAAVSLGI